MAKLLIGKVGDFPEGKLKQVEPNGAEPIAVAKVNGKICAIRGVCHHEGGPLGEGELEGKVITCPWHGSKWDITTGKCVEFFEELEPEPVYAVSTEGDNVYAEV